MPFDPIPDPSTLLGAVLAMERQLTALDQELDAAAHSASSADGSITAVANGTPRLIELSIAQAALDAANTTANLTNLANAVKTVVNQAMSTAHASSATRTGNLARSLSLQNICAPNAALPNIAGFPEAAAALTAEIPIIDQRIAARRLQGKVGPATATVNGYFEVITLTLDGFPSDAAVLSGQILRAINLGFEEGSGIVDQTIADVVGTIDQNSVGFAALCLYARGSLRIADRVQVKSGSSTFAAVANAGPAETNIGVDARVGNVWSMGPVTLRNNAHVVGFVKTNQTVTSQTTPPDVSGGVFPGTFIRLPNLSLQVNFPGTHQGAVNIEPPAQRTLAPGAWGAVTVKGRLQLSAGTYTFESFDLESQATLTIDSRAGRVILHVRGGNLIFRGKQVSVQGRANFFLGYFGTNMVVVGSPFTGTLVAPTALVDLATIPAPGYSGAFFGKDIVAHPDSTFNFVPHTGSPALGTF